MQLKFTVLAAALSASVAADFVIFTTPLPAINFNDIQSQISSFQSAASSRIADLTKSLPSSELARAASANSALRAFVASATVSVPAQVTEIGKYERFSTTPAWYSALPSDLRAYYDENNAKVQSIINDVAGRGSSGTTGGGPSQTGTAAGASGTGAASAEKVKAYMGVGAAAAFGVFIL